MRVCLLLVSAIVATASASALGARNDNKDFDKDKNFDKDKDLDKNKDKDFDQDWNKNLMCGVGGVNAPLFLCFRSDQRLWIANLRY